MENVGPISRIPGIDMPGMPDDQKGTSPVSKDPWATVLMLNATCDPPSRAVKYQKCTDGSDGCSPDVNAALVIAGGMIVPETMNPTVTVA